MTNIEAYGFALALAAGLLVPLLPVSLMLMRVDGASIRLGLRAGAIAGLVALLAASLIGAVLFAGPLRGTGGAPATDVWVLSGVAAALAVVLAAVGSMVIAVYRRLGLLAESQVRGTAWALVGCWALVVGLFAWGVWG